MRRIALLALAWPLLGCPYESKVPLGSSSEGRIDPALIGTWSCNNSEDERWTLLVSAFDETQYLMEVRDKEETNRFRAFSSEVAGSRLLKVRHLSKDLDDGYYFITYRIDGQTLLLLLADDRLLKGVPQAPAALREALAKERPGLFEDLSRCESTGDEKK